MVPREKEASSTKPQQMHNFYANISQSITRNRPGTHENMNEFTAIKSRREVEGGDGDSAAPPRHFTRSYPVSSVIKFLSLFSQSCSVWAALTAQRQLATLRWAVTVSNLRVFPLKNLIITKFKQRESSSQTSQRLRGTVVGGPKGSFAFISSQKANPQNDQPLITSDSRK